MLPVNDGCDDDLHDDVCLCASLAFAQSKTVCCARCHRVRSLWPGRNPKRYDAPADLVPLKECAYKGECNHDHMCQRCYKDIHPEQRAQQRAITSLSVLVNAAAALGSTDSNSQAPTRKSVSESDKENRPPSQSTVEKKPTSVKKTPSHSLQWQIKAASSTTSPLHDQVHRTTLKRQRDRLADMKAYKHTVTKRTRLPGAGRKPLLGESELDIVKWIKAQREKMIRVDDAGIIQMAVQTAAAKQISNFAASDGWFTGFKKRHNIVLRIVTSYSRKYSDAELDKKQREYVTQLLAEIQSKEVDYTFIFNMDETPIWKDTPPKTTYDFSGARSVPVQTTKHEKDRLTLVLCVSLLGELLPPLIIFKSVAKNQPLIEKYADSRGRFLYFCGHEKAYNDGRVMQKWIERVFLPHRKVPDGTASMLTMDNVAFHHKPECAAALLKKKVVVNTFPPNTTCRLQPLDHSINGIIKRKICSAWTKWMRRPNPAYTADGNLQQPQRQEIMDWVLTAVEGVQPEAIRRSFRHCWPTLMVLNE